jgi:hypothetical protein
MIPSVMPADQSHYQLIIDHIGHFIAKISALSDHEL